MNCTATRLLPLAALVLLLLMGAGNRAWADKYALCIGIDRYEEINPLRGAARDAQGVGKTLVECAGFPAANVQILVSGDKTGGEASSKDEIRPDRKTIVRALSDLQRRVKSGDVVFILFAGHGIEMDGQTYLLPSDCDGHNDLTLKESAISATLFREQIGSLNARAVILAFDMCRTDPRPGKRDIAPKNTFSDRMARAVRLKIESVGPDTPAHPLSTIVFFACSPQQVSWEWQAKQRGYFSYFLEQGLRNGAADEQGVVKAGSLIEYVKKAVAGAVQRDISYEQIPYAITEGANPLDLTLAEHRPAQSAGATAVPLVVGKSVDEQFDAAFQRGVELFNTKRYDAAQVKFEDALQLKPNSASTVNQLGRIQYRTHNYEVAENLFRKAMTLDPKLAPPVNGLATLYYDIRNDYPEAERLYRKAIELDPKFASPMNGLANLFYDIKNDYPEAEHLFRKAIELDSKDGMYYANLASCLLKMNRKEEAMTEAKRAIELGYKRPHPIFGELGLTP